MPSLQTAETVDEAGDIDATSFAIMRRLRLRHALAFDGEFAAVGFVEVRP